ncbi:expressed unknown protein [Seminavis robusta]|uniref:WW domain-containing protein n=1 Tax=Seminavis robusta TaxID=568900 RepID=A0A9N8EPH6_9STRA|nr:expressed unknown protein [Seminavis robusta]|eukprot:Sro1339_g264340.1 n/a (479) ;mRNA; f:26135-27571
MIRVRLSLHVLFLLGLILQYCHAWINHRVALLRPRKETPSSLYDAYREDDHGINAQKKLLEENLQELLQAQRKPPGEDTTNNFLPRTSGRMDLPDLNPFKEQLDKNAAGKPLSQALSMPDYFKDKKDNTKIPTTARMTTPIAPKLFSSSSEQGEENDDDTNNNEGFYLDPDIYERSRDLIRGDGSLALDDDTNSNSQLQQNNNKDWNSVDGRKAILERLLQAELESGKVPQSNNDNENDKDDWNTLFSLIQSQQQQQSSYYNKTQAEQVHRQILEHETGFLNQSKSFQQALIDPKAAQAATVERRNTHYQQRQERASKQLLQNMAEFERQLMQKERATTYCSRCQCQLADEDYDIAPQLWMRQRNLTALCQTCYKGLQTLMVKRLQQKPQPNRRSGPSASTTAARSVANSNNRPTQQSAAAAKQRRRGPIIKAPSKSAEEATTTSSAWTPMEDPDSGELFYSNQDTGEVRWEDPTVAT